MLIDHDALKELDDVKNLITWSRVETLLSEIHSSPKGEKAWPPLMVFKAHINVDEDGLIKATDYSKGTPQITGCKKTQGGFCSPC